MSSEPWLTAAIIAAAATIIAALIGQLGILLKMVRDTHRTRQHARNNRKAIEQLYDELQALKRERRE